MQTPALARTIADMEESARCVSARSHPCARSSASACARGIVSVAGERTVLARGGGEGFLCAGKAVIAAGSAVRSRRSFRAQEGISIGRAYSTRCTGAGALERLRLLCRPARHCSGVGVGARPGDRRALRGQRWRSGGRIGGVSAWCDWLFPLEYRGAVPAHRRRGRERRSPSTRG